MSDYARYFTGYPANIVDQVLNLINTNKLSHYLLKKYPHAHTITTDKLLYSYASELKKHYLKNAPPFGRAGFKKQGDMVANALGTHTYRMQGKTRKHDLAINSDLLHAPEPLLKALVVHELAHFKEKDHNKSFYKLCCHMEPQYHQLELDLRILCVAEAMNINPYKNKAS
ncbi:M48 family metallopeptidase [Pseudoalteromonas sp. MMG010]|uniref:M48 metallopeptidase family protein n=1 Tax=Pseudoalteromonas sp. MMG010 TaxID=2822685 RepID=UPI001B3A5D08|nr:YgjP-like metallopeptidase domain-containing protein [Pseudoalteromonas sp. MMG010]MBQ4834654.1 M48 family metallopeptidase [Pseudoalteromonas sp. MMG010]